MTSSSGVQTTNATSATAGPAWAWPIAAVLLATASLFSRISAKGLAHRATLANQFDVGQDLLYREDHPHSEDTLDESFVASLCEDGMLDYLVVPPSLDLYDGLQRVISGNGLSTVNGSAPPDCSDLTAMVGN